VSGGKAERPAAKEKPGQLAAERFFYYFIFLMVM